MPKRRRITTPEDALARMLDRPAPAPKPRQGGWQGNPNSIAALARHRPYGPDNLRKRALCRCGRPALKGRPRCQFHDPDWIQERDGWRELMTARRAARSGALPPALVSHPAFVAATASTDRIQERGAVLRDLVAGWIAMDRGQDDGQAWTAALARAHALGWV